MKIFGILFYLQGDCRTYSYVAAVSSDDSPCWKSLMVYAKIIPKLCHNVNRYENLILTFKPLEDKTGCIFVVIFIYSFNLI